MTIVQPMTREAFDNFWATHGDFAQAMTGKDKETYWAEVQTYFGRDRDELEKEYPNLKAWREEWGLP
jgi:hypothetical protein